MATKINLSAACSFAVLAGTAVTNTGNTVVSLGHVGASPSGTITGFPPGVVVPPFSIHAADTLAAQAQASLLAAYNQIVALPGATDLSGQVLGSGGTVPTLTPGIYKFTSSAQINGTLTLNGAGDYIFQIGSTLTTASASNIVLTGGATSNQIYWQVGSSATLGTNSTFRGNILALTSITVTINVTVDGKLLAINGTVTLDIDSITGTTCAVLFTPRGGGRRIPISNYTGPRPCVCR